MRVMPDENTVINQMSVFVIRFQRVNSSARLPTLCEALDLEGGTEHVVPLGNLVAECVQEVMVSPQFLDQCIDQPGVIWVGFHQRIELVFELFDRVQN